MSDSRSIGFSFVRSMAPLASAGPAPLATPIAILPRLAMAAALTGPRGSASLP